MRHVLPGLAGLSDRIRGRDEISISLIEAVLKQNYELGEVAL